MVPSKIAYALLFLQIAPSLGPGGPVVSAKLQFHYEPGAVDLGRITKEEWAAVQSDLFRYENALESFRKANGSDGYVKPGQAGQLQESVQSWIDASSLEYRRYAQIIYCEDNNKNSGMVWGWKCLEPAFCQEMRVSDLCVLFVFFQRDKFPTPNVTLAEERVPLYKKMGDAELFYRTGSRKPSWRDASMLPIYDNTMPGYYVKIWLKSADTTEDHTAIQHGGYARAVRAEHIYDARYVVHYIFFF
ncbi:unnamed protein product, partial [Mesorhabditis spiculigera]